MPYPRSTAQILLSIVLLNCLFSQFPPNTITFFYSNALLIILLCCHGQYCYLLDFPWFRTARFSRHSVPALFFLCMVLASLEVRSFPVPVSFHLQNCFRFPSSPLRYGAPANPWIFCFSRGFFYPQNPFYRAAFSYIPSSLMPSFPRLIAEYPPVRFFRVRPSHPTTVLLGGFSPPLKLPCLLFFSGCPVSAFFLHYVLAPLQNFFTALIPPPGLYALPSVFPTYPYSPLQPLVFFCLLPL